ncbi:MAG: AMP-binding protein [Luminiphilus sp.]|jgi:non-ribosomal peptide synthetase-like protein|nr:AMP-binding protein [Luminiphilus sp.]
MTLLWILVIPAAVTAAWLRYRSVVAHDAPATPAGPTLTQTALRTCWGAHEHQRGAQWLHEIFERSAAKFPDHIALSLPETGESLTYAQLNQQANQLAGVISEFITAPDQVVAVCLPQNTSTAVALHLAILKAGAVQCFIDVESPAAMRQQVLQDAQPALLIADDMAATPELPTLITRELGFRAQSTSAQLARSPWLDEPGKRLASLFYTSGTTGLPKGVECPHAGYINLAQSYATFYDFIAGTDASSLTSSLGYDGSISEMYSAWLAGCEVVVLSKTALRSGPALLPILRDAHVTALFCPPVLLSTLSANPEYDLPYPICRYIVAAGEAFPASLVAPWSRARRQIINTYGPTEVSTDTSRQLLRPGEPVTIGSPFPGVSYTIVDPETLAPLNNGQQGELVIGGIQLARGYRDLPEITASRFIDHPHLGRLYRSGDRCHVDPHTHRIHFHGRIDSQLKVRGYRVEVQPIESLLQDHFPAIETAVLDCQDNELIALLRAPSLSLAASTKPIQRLHHGMVDEAQKLISERFPPYAVPSRFFLIEQFNLVTASGKIDRRALPKVIEAAGDTRAYSAASTPDAQADTTPLPSWILDLCRAELGTALEWDDDFIDWGAHSIAIARLSQRLQEASHPVPVRALLTDARSAAKIVQFSPSKLDTGTHALHAAEKTVPTRHQTVNHSRQFSFLGFTLRQSVAIVLLRVPLLMMAALGLAIIDPEELLLAGNVLGFLLATLIGYGMYMFVPFTNLGWVLLMRLLQRQLPDDPDMLPGRYQKFSSHHLQLWWLERQTDFVLKPLVNGLRSPMLFNWALRRLGGNIHPKAFIAQSTEWYGPLSLVTIQSEAIVQAGAQISTVSWEGEHFFLDHISIGRQARVGSRAMVSGGGSLGTQSWLTPLSSLDTVCEARQQVSGVPGSAVGAYRPPRTPTVVKTSALQERALEIRNLLMQLSLEILLVVLPGAAIALLTTWFLGFDALSKVSLDAQPLTTGDLLIMSGAGMMGIWLGVLFSSLILCTFLRLTPTPPGWIATNSLLGISARYRQTKMNQIQQIWGWSLTGQYLRAWAGVKFSKVGASECDALFNLLPEQLHADANVFIAQGCYCNVLDEHGAFLLVQPLHMPAGFFASNNAMVEPGPLPGNFLLGVSTPVGPHLYRQQYTNRHDPRRVISGNPPLEMGSLGPLAPPAHPPPSLGIFLARFALNDLASVGVIPGITVFLATLLLVTLNMAGFSNIAAALLTSVIVPMSLPVLALMVKLLLVGNRWGEHNTAPFWSVRHFTYFLAQDCFFRLMAGFMSAVSGTALANPILRLFGCRIGERTLIGLPLQMSDWHAVNIGSDCVINGQMQLHSFEDRILTVSRTTIGNRTVINHGTMLMGGAALAEGATVDAQSLVLKSMCLEAGRHGGSPTQEIRGAHKAAGPA